ncbi:MAG: hypothetical protein U5K31_14265 [Balneolaceae bacterium]|nr:hypothetical protein [Balneolaceae bacterium]
MPGKMPFRSMFGHQPKPKRFDYEYRYYDPKQEEREKRRIKIDRPYKKTHQGKSIVLYAICLSFVVWLIYQLGTV